MVRLCSWLASVCAVLILLGVILGLGGGIWFPLDVLAHFRLHFLLVIPLAAILALLGRNWTALARLGVALLLAVAGLAPIWNATSPADAAPDRQVLTVMTANLNYLNTLMPFVRRALVEADADILVTQETDQAVMNGPDSLARHYPHRLSLTRPRKRMRVVMWSKFPLKDGRMMLDDKIGPPSATAVARLGNGREVLVMGLHLNHAVRGNQQAQVAAMAGLLEGRPFPRIVMGDFNATPWSWSVATVSRASGTRVLPGYRRTWRGTYPTPWGDWPALLGQPIDHVLVSPGIGLSGIEVVPIPGSDHKAVKVVLTLP